ncbi:MAG: type II secretion system protein [Planctomycetes bacterium]|nr:type II secretion system protein [Planctomycetota bacterium]
MVIRVRPGCNGFTLVELLIVIAIISVLVGMLLAAVGPIRESVRRTRTRAIVQDINIALATIATEGRLLAPVEHPIAASAAPRSVFVRAGSVTLVDQTAAALVAKDLSWIDTSDQSRVLLSTDLYQGGTAVGDCQLPFAYGVERSRLSVLSAADLTVTSYLRMPESGSRFFVKLTGILQKPYDNTVYPDREFLFQPQFMPGQTLESESKKNLEQNLSLQRTEILQKGGLFTADLADGTLIVGGRLWTPNGGLKRTVPLWEPGYVKDAGAWKRYRLRGTALYDAWGDEILVSLLSNDAYRIESAGRDGVVRWSPGIDGIYQTQPSDTSPSGDDRDGTLDNVSSVTKE